MIEYRKNGLNDENLGLINKLSKRFPIDSLILDIKNKFVSVVECRFMGRLYGVIICRGEINRNEKLVLVALHVIAADHLAEPFSKILTGTFDKFLYDNGFHYLRMETDNSGLYKLAHKYFGEPKTYVFEKALDARLPISAGV